MDEIINYRDLNECEKVQCPDELPIVADLRLLQYGVSLCTRAGCLKLAERLKMQMENHRNGIGRRPL